MSSRAFAYALGGALNNTADGLIALQAQRDKQDWELRMQAAREKAALNLKEVEEQYKIAGENRAAERATDPDLIGAGGEQLTKAEARGFLAAKNKAKADTDAAQGEMFNAMQGATQAEAALAKENNAGAKDIADKQAQAEFEKTFGTSADKDELKAKLAAAKAKEDEAFDKALGAAEKESKAAEKIRSKREEDQAFKDKEAAEKRVEDAKNKLEQINLKILADKEKQAADIQARAERQQEQFANKEEMLRLAASLKGGSGRSADEAEQKADRAAINRASSDWKSTHDKYLKAKAENKPDEAASYSEAATEKAQHLTNLHQEFFDKYGTKYEPMARQDAGQGLIAPSYTNTAIGGQLAAKLAEIDRMAAPAAKKEEWKRKAIAMAGGGKF